MRVVIVDDSRAGRLALKKVLPPHLLANLVEGGGGAEAVRVCSGEEPIGLMLLDLTMPEVDGYQVLEELSRSGRLPPTVVVSADVQPLAATRVKALGALAFLRKWPSREELVAGERRIPLAISVGVAAMEGDALTPATLIERADRALYDSKRTGRNRVTAYTVP